jgi:hypothetical protein
MAKKFDLSQIREKVAFILNFNEGQLDSDFSKAQIDMAINESYLDEVSAAIEEGDRRWFHHTQDIIWPEKQRVLTLPDSIAGKNIINIKCENTSQPVKLEDYNRLAWSRITGPTKTKTLSVTYMPEPSSLINDSDEPYLVPRRHRHVIAWAAAILLRQVADEVAPQQWVIRHQQIRLRFWSDITRGRPIEGGVPRISQDGYEEDIYEFQITEY